LAAHEAKAQIAAVSQPLYDAIDAIEQYRALLQAEADATADERAKRRLQQMRTRLEGVVQTLEDRCLAELLEVKDMYFNVQMINQGKFV
jgi:light-regulated signal transduction histidine kinase (bacteriophytochrome)